MRLALALGCLLVAGALWWALRPATVADREQRGAGRPGVTQRAPGSAAAPASTTPKSDTARPARAPRTAPGSGGESEAERIARKRAERAAARVEAAAILERVRQKAPETRAPAMGPEAVRFAIDQAKPGIVDCYEQALAKTPDLAGKLVVRFTIHAKDGSGTLRDAEIVEDGPNNPFLGMCALGAIAKVEFEAEADGIVTVNYPFRLAPRTKKE